MLLTESLREKVVSYFKAIKQEHKMLLTDKQVDDYLNSPMDFYWDSNSSTLDLNLLFQLLLNESTAFLPEEYKDVVKPCDLQFIDHLVDLIREGKLTATKIGNQKIEFMRIE